MTKRNWLILTICTGIMAGKFLALANIPTALTDTISKGSGTINLLTDVSSAELQTYLQGGIMNLGIDLNEAASGNETSTSQGIAIRDLELILQTSNGIMTFDNFYTNTSASILESGAQSAQTFNTVFGRTGSNGITGGSFTNYDDVIYMEGINLGGATITGAEIRVRFLTTATNAGYNEEFFDYSAGYENFALLDTQTAKQIEMSADSIVSTYSGEQSVMQPSSLNISSPAATPEPGWYFLLGGPAILVFRRWRKHKETFLQKT